MIFLLCLGLLLSTSVSARTCDREWDAYTSMKQIEGLLVDTSSVWAATTGGVLRYDRVQRRYDRFTRPDGLAGNRILSLAADDEGNLWFGSDGQGLSRYRPATSTFDPAYLEFRGLAITSLLSVGTRLFVGTSSGVSLFLTDREEVKETYRLLGDLPKDAAALDMALLDGTLFVGTAQGIAWARLDQPNLQDPESWRSLSTHGPAGTVVPIGGVLYAATRGGVLTYDPEEESFRPDYWESVVSLGSRGRARGGGHRGGRTGGAHRRGVSGWGSRPRRSRRSRPSAPRGRTCCGSAPAPVCTSSATSPPSRPANRDRAGSTRSRSRERKRCGRPACPTTCTARPASITCPRAAGRSTSEGASSLSRPTPKGASGPAAGGPGSPFARREGWRKVPTDETVLRSSSSNNPNFVVVSDIHRDQAGRMWLLNTLVGVAVFDGYPPERQFLFDQEALGLLPGLDLYRMDIGPGGLKWARQPQVGSRPARRRRHSLHRRRRPHDRPLPGRREPADERPPLRRPRQPGRPGLDGRGKRCERPDPRLRPRHRDPGGLRLADLRHLRRAALGRDQRFRGGRRRQCLGRHVSWPVAHQCQRPGGPHLHPEEQLPHRGPREGTALRRRPRRAVDRDPRRPQPPAPDPGGRPPDRSPPTSIPTPT